MPIEYPYRQVVEALRGYREHTHDLMSRALALAGTSTHTIAAVSEKFAFVYQFYLVADKKQAGGEISELFYMCDEFFEFAGGQKPENKPVYEFSIDFILKMLKEPFMMIAAEDRSLEYLLRECETVGTTNLGRILKSKQTTFNLYTQQEIEKATARPIPLRAQLVGLN